MKKIYNYLYYRAYDLLGLTGNYDLAWGASHLLSALFMFLIGTIAFKCGIKNYFEKWEHIGFLLVGIFLMFHLINYFLFLKGERYKSIVEEHKNESAKSKKTGRIISVLIIAILVYSLF